MASFQKVSIKDVAEKAGVSTALVSFVLNDRWKDLRVNPKTASRILRIAEEMSYHPNMAAKSLRGGKTAIIGGVISDISNSFFSHIARIIEDEAAKLGYTVLFGSSDEDAGKMERVVFSLLNKGVDGMIIVPCEKSEHVIDELVKRNVPIVLLDRLVPEINVSCVVLNNFNATYSATKHLLEAGYKSPCMMAYDVSLYHMEERIRGYRQAMCDMGLKDAVHVGLVKYNAPQRIVEKAISKIIASGGDSIIFATNTISLACLHVIKDLNVPVPEVGLVGFDGSNAFDFFHSPLTYIKQPIDVMGQRAVEILHNVIKNKGKSVHSLLIESELIVRHSSRPL